MNNYLRMTLLLSVVLAFSALFVSAYPSYSYTPAYNGYAQVSNSFSYTEGDNGFAIDQSSNVPRTDVVQGCDYYDWTADFRKCRQTAYYNGYREDSYSYDSDSHYYDNFRAYYDQDKAIKEAFKTYQQSSKQQYQLESQRLNLRYQRSYGYGGYGSGYARYSWGW